MLNNLVLTVPLWRVGVMSLAMGVYSAVALLPYEPIELLTHVPLGLEAALTFAIGMILLFRTNRAYERWWEARSLWGDLVNASRNLAVKARSLAAPDGEELRELRRLIPEYAYALKDHLRGESRTAGVTGLAEGQEPPEHVPSYLAGRLYRILKGWRDADRISPEELWMLDTELREFLIICGACEKIKTTLMAQSWRTFVHQCLLVYLVTLPWGLVQQFTVGVIPLTIGITYFVTASETIAMYVEEPFGDEEDHLDMESICAAIQKSVGEILR